MSGKEVNVLIYSGIGAASSSVKHATWSLRRLLGPNYAVLTVSAEQILKEPWSTTCALLVFPGGADLGYCRTLNGDGNRRIKQYVQLGGKYLGLCAGGYYGTARCEFEAGKVKEGMEVVGDRELGFFPGICRGLAFPGFVYHSEAGTRAVEVDVNREAFASKSTAAPDKLKVYYNGGGVFVDTEKFKDRGVEILASYVYDLAVDSGEGKAAVVYCKVGDGAALLTGPHPEFSGLNLNPNEPSGHHDYPSVVQALVADEQKRVDFMRACLTKLGLTVSDDAAGSVPSLSRLHLSSAKPGEVSELVHSWHEASILSKDENDREIIKGENDTFILEQQGAWDTEQLREALREDLEATDPAAEGGIIDYNTVPKRLVPHEHSLPDTRETPFFNHYAFFSNLRVYSMHHASPSEQTFGRTILYGEVVTSTSTLLEKNPTLLSHLPIGTTATARTQVAGRGRGTNVWVSPPGSLMFSTLLKHSIALSTAAPVVFVQYLAAMAIVAGIKEYDRGYDRMPVKLKWPNDIYARDPNAAASDPRSGAGEADEEEERKKYVKVGGILVNSSYAGGDYTLVVGIGLNVSNASSPTTSLNNLARSLHPPLPPFTLEKLLASILTQFEGIYTRFCRTGFGGELERRYYGLWLHSRQVVTLEAEGGARARIEGVTTDWGLLVAEEVEGKGRRWALQSDGNSFDFFKGLLKRKT
ncbi:biotin holocarboxylase synthetase/biotin-protein ligase [Teratosphaeria nubilosa]|uniref:Biotin holocarboxylase synthetase/biotin-protein ligase n=1 Tax=Teratosphaeria nubilosa TaxID=161662 RepID=A0A6G1LEA1_9PEZI|nr:biotin holocarboxylase synthetase/biotin-protein ligase [Teratosphaeria nubilosa]